MRGRGRGRAGTAGRRRRPGAQPVDGVARPVAPVGADGDAGSGQAVSSRLARRVARADEDDLVAVRGRWGGRLGGRRPAARGRHGDAPGREGCARRAGSRSRRVRRAAARRRGRRRSGAARRRATAPAASAPATASQKSVRRSWSPLTTSTTSGPPRAPPRRPRGAVSSARRRARTARAARAARGATLVAHPVAGTGVGVVAVRPSRRGPRRRGRAATERRSRGRPG